MTTEEHETRKRPRPPGGTHLSMDIHYTCKDCGWSYSLSRNKACPMCKTKAELDLEFLIAKMIDFCDVKAYSIKASEAKNIIMEFKKKHKEFPSINELWILAEEVGRKNVDNKFGSTLDKVKNFSILGFNTKKLMIYGSYLVLIVGLIIFVFAYFLNWTLPGIAVALLFSGIAQALPILYIIPAIILIRHHLKDKPKYSLVVAIITGVLVVSSLLPIFAVPWTLQDTEKQFRDMYGDDYTELDTTGMIAEPFSLWKLYNVMPSENPEIETIYNIEYYDNGLDKFYFDYYAPLNREGPYPVIIAVHGGAWFLGNKGGINDIPWSKYMASQGYVVFDLQYGLADIETAADTADLELVADLVGGLLGISEDLRFQVLPDYKGDYGIPEQVANIGQFTKFLASNAEKYDADLDNVFILGRSAGGNIGGVVGTGYYNPKFAGTFSNALNIQGIILYYPPTDVKKMSDAMAAGTLASYPKLSPAFDDFIDDGTMTEEEFEKAQEKYSPAYLIQDNNRVAPIIVVHANLDGLVPYQEQGVAFYEIAKEYDRDCIFVTIPFEGHGFDLFGTQSPGWQITTYYIERFIALEVD